MAPAAAADPLGILAEIELDPKKGDLIEQLQQALGGKSSRICLVFRLMDTDNSGAVSKEDFSSVMLQHMQLRCVDKQTIDLLFDLWDTDSSGQLTLQQLEDQLNGTADESAHFQHQLTKYDVGKGQVEGGGVVTALYWTATIIFAVCVFAVTQVIGAFAWGDQDETSFPAKMLAAPAYLLRTNEEYYKPSPEVSPTGWLSDQGFLRYSTLVLWIIVCVTGLGLELVLGEPMVKSLMARGDQNSMQLWKAAQLFFSLAISVALFSQSPFGLPWAVAGFWKLGFPETLGCFRRALRMGTARKPKFTSALAAWLDGIGSLIHHCSGAYLVVSVTTHLCPLDRRCLAMSLPLVGQHIFVLLKYQSLPLYCIGELILEIIFEWEVFANLADFSFENGYDSSIRGAALSMTFAHWCYWSAAFLEVPEMLAQLNHKSVIGSIDALAKDSSGMDFEEFEAVIMQKEVPIAKPQLQMLFNMHDADKSGTIDSGEVEKLISQMHILFPDMDKKGDKKEVVFEVAVV
jgi:Ca2+-binding EF-hand superfamily protein